MIVTPRVVHFMQAFQLLDRVLKRYNPKYTRVEGFPILEVMPLLTLPEHMALAAAIMPRGPFRRPVEPAFQGWEDS